MKMIFTDEEYQNLSLRECFFFEEVRRRRILFGLRLRRNAFGAMQGEELFAVVMGLRVQCEEYFDFCPYHLELNLVCFLLLVLILTLSVSFFVVECLSEEGAHSSSFTSVFRFKKKVLLVPCQSSFSFVKVEVSRYAVIFLAILCGEK